MNVPENIRAMQEEMYDEWKDLTPSDRVDELNRMFVETYGEIARAALEIEASRGNLQAQAPRKLQELVGRDRRNIPWAVGAIEAAIKDGLATQSLRRSKTITEMMDALRVAQGIVALEFFGDESPLGKRADGLIVMINQLEWISDVIQDASAEVKSRTMDTMRIEGPRLPEAMAALDSEEKEPE